MAMAARTPKGEDKEEAGFAENKNRGDWDEIRVRSFSHNVPQRVASQENL